MGGRRVRGYVERVWVRFCDVLNALVIWRVTETSVGLLQFGQSCSAGWAGVAVGSDVYSGEIAHVRRRVPIVVCARWRNVQAAGVLHSERGEGVGRARRGRGVVVHF